MSKKIILIDSNSPESDVTGKAFSEGIELIHVEDALAGIDISVEEKPELILVESDIEGLSIASFCKLLKKYDGRDIPVILMTDNGLADTDTGIAEAVGRTLTPDIISYISEKYFPSPKPVAPPLPAQQPESKPVEMEPAAAFDTPGEPTVDIGPLLGWPKENFLKAMGKNKTESGYDPDVNIHFGSFSKPDEEEQRELPVEEQEEETDFRQTAETPPVFKIAGENDENVYNLPDMEENEDSGEFAFFMKPVEQETEAASEPDWMSAELKEESPVPSEEEEEACPVSGVSRLIEITDDAAEDESEEEFEMADEVAEEPEEVDFCPVSAGSGMAEQARQAQVLPLFSAPAGSAAFGNIPDDEIARAVRSAIEKIAPQIIEQIAWEVIPDLAEILIKKEIERLKKE